MKLPKIKHSFTSDSDADFSLFGEDIITGLTDNDFFPDVAPHLAVFAEALKAFQLSIPTPSERSPARTAAKRIKKEQAVQELILLSYYVSFVARFNLEALETTNFELVEKPKSKGLLGLVKGLQIKTNGTIGMAIISCDKDDNATLYNARISKDQVNWLWQKSNTSRTVKVPNLPIGERLYVQMQLENTNGTSPWSQSKIGIILENEAILSIHE